MTESDYWTAVGIMQTVWTNQPVPDETAKAWWKLGLFADLAASDVEAAITALAASEVRSPMPSQIRGWIARRATAEMDALWSEVWHEILRARAEPVPWTAFDWTPAVKPFVEHIGVDALNALNPSSDTPVPVAQSSLRRMWEAWREREEDRRVTGSLPTVAAFRRAHSQPRLSNGMSPIGEFVPQLVKAVGGGEE
jgi:hypothetical protein